MAYTLDEKIYSYELCHTGTVKPSYLMRYMQTAAGIDTEKLGAGYQFLREHDMVFVITKLKLEMFANVKEGDEIRVKTWQKEIRGATFIRDFELKRGDEIIGYASTQWALMSFAERRPVRPSRMPVPSPSCPDIPSRDVELERHIEHPESAVKHGAFKRTVMLSDLDENLHLNNTNYADIMLDFLPQSISASSFEMLQINFRGEARLNDELEINVYHEGKTVYYYAENLTKSHVCFEGKIRLK